MNNIGQALSTLLLATALVACATEATPDDVAGTAAVNHLSHITILGTSGASTDPLHLRVASVDEVDEVDAAPVRLALRASDGTRAPVATTESHDGVVVVPPLRLPPQVGLVATLEVYLDDALYGEVDVYAQARLPEVPPGMAPALIDRAPGSLLIDLAHVERPARGPSAGVVDDRVPALTGGQAALTTCGNGIYGPGIGYFQSASPGSGGQRFSIFPEWGGPTLFWAYSGEMAIDSIYRAQWGCGTAYKVPNNCTVAVSAAGAMSYCCGFPYYTPSWVNTYASTYWPDCPLF